MILYDSRDCPYGMKVRIVLAEKELDHTVREVDLSSGQHRQAEFLKLNPFGKVPVLVDDDLVVYDSTIINEYLDDEYPAPGLRPAEDSGLRARMRLLEDYADVAFTMPALAIRRELAKDPQDRDDARLQTARDVVQKGLAMLDRELHGREYLIDTFSLADVAFAPTALQLDALGVRVEASHTALKAWINRLASRPSIGSVLRLVA